MTLESVRVTRFGGWPIAAGASYFGNRILRHGAADTEALARRHFTGVLHLFSENDLYYYRDHIRYVDEEGRGPRPRTR